MSAGTREILPEVSVPEFGEIQVVALGGDELLETFAEVMREWGHYRTAKGLRYPTLAEARQAAAGRRAGRGWNTSPIPDRH